jgi:hypothetical protein
MKWFSVILSVGLLCGSCSALPGQKEEKVRARAEAVLEKLKDVKTPEGRLKIYDDALKIDPSFALAWQQKRTHLQGVERL